mmetsp:Transcript_15705/g.26494  ORF Transcript_15705/g.26494 Transcript_15705/m.26494 type:complete len:203 (+) Transcript_15705:358-966(+)
MPRHCPSLSLPVLGSISSQTQFRNLSTSAGEEYRRRMGTTFFCALSSPSFRYLVCASLTAACSASGTGGASRARARYSASSAPRYCRKSWICSPSPLGIFTTQVSENTSWNSTGVLRIGMLSRSNSRCSSCTRALKLAGSAWLAFTGEQSVKATVMRPWRETISAPNMGRSNASRGSMHTRHAWKPSSTTITARVMRRNTAL